MSDFLKQHTKLTVAVATAAVIIMNFAALQSPLAFFPLKIIKHQILVHDMHEHHEKHRFDHHDRYRFENRNMHSDHPEH